MVLIPDQLPGAGVLRLRKPLSGVEDYYVLVRSVTTIGRHPGNNIALPKSSVSRHHAKIEHNGESYSVEDLGSSNGTFVNGQPIRFLEIKNRDTVTFGDVEFTFFLDEETTPRHGTRAESTQVHLRGGSDVGDGAESVESEVLRTQSVVDAEKAFTDIGEIHSVSQAIKYLRTHYRFLEIIRQRPSEDRLMDSFLEILFDAMRADRGVIMLSSEDSAENLHPAAVHLRSGEDATEEVNISQTITAKCIREQVAILSADVTRDSRFSQSESILARPVRSAICVPLLIRSRVLGLCYLDTRKGIHAFDDADLRFVTNLSSQLALAIDNLRMTRERLQAEQLSIIGRTMTEIAHNIKNTLLITKGGVEMMDKHLDEEDLNSVKSTWDLVRRGMDRVNRMATDMLSYARLENRKRREVYVNEVIDEAVDQYRPQLESRGIALRFEASPQIGHCWLDPVGLYDVITNLLVNAGEAIPEDKQGHIQINTKSAPGQVVISIADNGGGIAPEDEERIFLPFYTTKDHGTGMGLAMVKRYTAEMGGTIRLQTQSESGTTIELTFPLIASLEEDEAAAPAGKVEQSP